MTSKNGLQMSQVFREVARKFLRLLTRFCTIYSIIICIYLFSGSESPLTDRMTWLKRSVAQVLAFAITRRHFKPAKHIILLSAVKSFTGNVGLIQLLNRLGHGIAYSQLEELNSSLCLQKLCMAEQITRLSPAR